MTNHDRLLKHLDEIYTNIKTDKKDIILGNWEGVEYSHYLLTCDEDNAFYIPLIDEGLQRYEGAYYIIYNPNNDKYYIFSRYDMDEAIVLDHLFDSVVINDKIYEKVYLSDIIKRLRGVI